MIYRCIDIQGVSVISAFFQIDNRGLKNKPFFTVDDVIF